MWVEVHEPIGLSLFWIESRQDPETEYGRILAGRHPAEYQHDWEEGRPLPVHTVTLCWSRMPAGVKVTAEVGGDRFG